jgi:hypothetical protein
MTRWIVFGVVLVGLGCGDSAPASISKTATDYPTFRALHEAVVVPICGPRGGVCHNSKQFPDLHTPDNMLAVLGQRCNQLTDDPMAIQDLCEPPGDLLLIRNGPDAGWRARVGYATLDPGGQTMTVTLHDPVPHAGAALDFSIVRDVDPAHPVELHVGTHLVTTAAGKSVQVTDLPTLTMGLRYFMSAPYMPGFAGQLAGGDPNHNGIFGADLGGAVIKPGAPDKSFLVQRILGIVPPQMPLANGTLTPEQIYAFQCWIAQMKPDGSNADGAIDYSLCPPQFAR